MKNISNLNSLWVAQKIWVAEHSHFGLPYVSPNKLRDNFLNGLYLPEKKYKSNGNFILIENKFLQGNLCWNVKLMLNNFVFVFPVMKTMH